MDYNAGFEGFETQKDYLSEVEVNNSPYKNGSTVSIIIEFAKKAVQVKLHMN